MFLWLRHWGSSCLASTFWFSPSLDGSWVRCCAPAVLSSSPLVGCLSYPFSRLLFGPLSESPPEGFSVGLPCLFGRLRLALLPTVPFGTSSLYLCSRFLHGGVRLPFDSSTRLYFHPSVGVTTFGGVVRLLCQFRAQTVLLVLFCYSILSLLFFLSSFRPRGFG